MKILQVPRYFHPDPMGGTEVYVAGLTSELQARGHEVTIAAPHPTNEFYVYDEIPVHRFAVHQASEVRQFYDEGDDLGSSMFARILDKVRPAVVHLHAFTREVSLKLVRKVKACGLPVVFTYHVAAVSCQRGTMMRWGNQACDGRMRMYTCARCALHGLLETPAASSVSRGRDLANRAIANVVGSFPPRVGQTLGALNFRGGLWTALRMTELVQLRHANVRDFFDGIDHIVAVAEWVRKTLINNGVSEAKITLSRHGLAEVPAGSTCSQSVRVDDPSMRIAFLGRFDPVKGLDVLIKAIRILVDVPVTLDVFGIAVDERERAYERRLVQVHGTDKRIRFHHAIRPEEVITRLRSYNAVVVPSQGIESGPLVVLEAIAAGVPVIGSDLGGIAENVTNGVNGILVPPNSTEDWAGAILRCYRDRELLPALRKGLAAPRTMAAVADEMLRVYEGLAERC